MFALFRKCALFQILYISFLCLKNIPSKPEIKFCYQMNVLLEYPPRKRLGHKFCLKKIGTVVFKSLFEAIIIPYENYGVDACAEEITITLPSQKCFQGHFLQITV